MRMKVRLVNGGVVTGTLARRSEFLETIGKVVSTREDSSVVHLVPDRLVPDPPPGASVVQPSAQDPVISIPSRSILLVETWESDGGDD